MAARSFIFLGTGTSVGVPMIGCDCAVCRSPNPRNHRYRCAVLIQATEGNLLIDTPPELRLQLLRERIGVVHAVLFTHYHADHLFGLDDLRPIPHKLGGPVPLYCTAEVEGKIRTTFAYAFGPSAADTSAGYLPKLTFRRITDEPFSVLGERVTPVPLEHAAFRRVRLPHRRRGLLHRRQRHPARAGRSWRGCACWCWTRCGRGRTSPTSASTKPSTRSNGCGRNRPT